MKHFFLLLATLLLSCSDKLSNSNAKDLIEACDAKGKSNIRTWTLLIGNNLKTTSNEVQGLDKLVKEGLIELKVVKHENIFDFVDISLTAKSKDLVVEKDSCKSLFGGMGETIKGCTSVKIKQCDYVIDEIIEIQEIPAYNLAQVKVKYIKRNVTAFDKFSNNKVELIENLTIKKTNNGWKYCD